MRWNFHEIQAIVYLRPDDFKIEGSAHVDWSKLGATMPMVYPLFSLNIPAFDNF